MEVSQTSSAPMGPPSASPNGDKAREPQQQQQQQQQHQQQQQRDQDDTNGSSAQPTGAAAAAQQPKVVQTAFIHKLYKFVILV